MRRRADGQAREVAEHLGGVVVPNSGAGIHKGDVDLPHGEDGRSPKIECKFTDKESLSLKLDWLRKLTDEAIDSGRFPVVHIRFTSADKPVKKDWVLVEYDEWRYLMDRVS